VVTEAEGVCAQSVKAEKSRTKETEVRVLILSGILALQCACKALANGPIEPSCSLHISRFHLVAVLLEVVQSVLGARIQGADTRIKGSASTATSLRESALVVTGKASLSERTWSLAFS